MIDIHCHILPYVDDGAVHLDEAMDLLYMEAEQGVTELCLTPHLRGNMFGTPDEKIRSQFQKLCLACREEEIPLKLHLSREYYYDEQFLSFLEEGHVLPMGSNRTLLVEFSYYSDFAELAEAAEAVMEAGYQPLFAHVERYKAIQREPALAQQLVQMGVKLQLNADGVLGRGGFREKRTCKYLLKNGLVYAVASDAHDTRVRKPSLAKCREYLEKKYGRDYAMALLSDNPGALLV